MRRYVIAIPLLLIFGATGARSADQRGSESNPYVLSDSIVVTANRKPTPIREIGSTVTVVTPDQSASESNSVADLLRTVPGVDVAQSGGPGKTTAVFLRGANAHHTLVLIDGVEMNDPSSSNGAFDFGNLTTDNIERIEILRGSQSVLYGSDAIGGVIHIFTKTGSTDKPKVELNLTTGTYATYNESVRLSGRQQRLDYSLHLGRIDTDGFSATTAQTASLEPDGLGSTEFSGQLGFAVSEQFEARLAGRYLQAKSDIDGSSGVLDDPNYENETIDNSVRFQFKKIDQEADYQPSLEVGYLDHDYYALNLTDPDHPTDESEYAANGKRVRLSTGHSVKLASGLTATLGLESEQEKYSSETHSNGAYGPYDDIVGEQSATTNSVYLLEEFAYQNQLFITLGGRIDDHELFGDETTWRATAAYLIPDLNMKMRGSAGTGFKAPTLFQLLHPSWGNPNLSPETSRSWELGLEYSPVGRLNLNGTYFHNDYRQLVGTDPATYALVNIDKARSRGFEVEAEYHLHQSRFALYYNYTRTENLTNDSPILRRPKEKFSARLNQQLGERLSCALQTQHIGERMDIDFNSYPSMPVSLESYWLTDFSLKYQFSQMLELRGGVMNLFDEPYTEIFTYATPGRTYSVGARVSL